MNDQVFSAFYQYECRINNGMEHDRSFKILQGDIYEIITGKILFSEERLYLN